MTEVKYILTTMTSRSLIIIDELCRSTSVDEGTAIAMAICEDLARSGAYTYVTTHYTLLTKLADLFVNIKVWQMQTIPSGNPSTPKSIKLDYKFSLIPGITTLRGYGIYMTRNIWPDEVLAHVDAFQSQLTKTTNDPKFPSIDKRVRLKYDLECKLKKLKLRKKLTITNVNKHINDYNNEMANIGETAQNSQIMVPELHCTTDEENREMDHSIFNASKNVYECAASESSQLNWNNIENYEENNAFYSVPQSKQSIYLEPDGLNNPKIPRSQETFTPDTIRDEQFQSQSTYYGSINSNQHLGMFYPEVNISYSPSECSLNFTKQALNLEEDEYHSQTAYNIEDPRINNPHEEFYERQREADPIYDSSRVPFRQSKNILGPIVSYEASEISSRDLSQQLEMIRKERMSLRMAQEPLHNALPDLSSETRNSILESPFINTFVRPLQSDTTRTSTPLITRIKYNARDFGSSSTSIRTFDYKMRVTTPKIDFPILNNVPGVDVQAVQEDLESFVEDMRNEEVNISYSPSEYTLNLSKKALNLEEDEYRSQITYNIEAPQINQTQEEFYERQRQDDPVHDSSRVVFKETKNIMGPIVSYESSEISSCDLSQQLEMIRKERMIAMAQEPLHNALPDLSSEPRNSILESPFINTFVCPLQGDTTRTSTPLITRIKYNARDFGSSSTSIRTIENKIRVTTPKIDFTILNNASGVDIQSVQEDLESFVEDMQNGEFSSEEDVPGCRRQDKNVETIPSEDGGKGETFTEQIKRDKDVSAIIKNADSEQNARKKAEQNRIPHFFPVVTIIEGPNQPSSEEDNNSYIDHGTVVAPTVRNPQPSNQKEIDLLITAFNSLSEPKNIILPQTGCDSDKNINNYNYCPTTNEHLDQAPKKAGNNIDELTEAFNSLSNPRKVENNRKQTITNTSTHGESHLSEKNRTRRNGDKIKTPKDTNGEQISDFNNHCKELQNYDLNRDAVIRSPESHAEKNKINNLIENRNYSDTLKQTDENTADCYESPRSSPDISYSPLTTQSSGVIDNKHTSKWQESVYHDIEDCEDESGNISDRNKGSKEIIMKDIKRVAEVTELSDDELFPFENTCDIVTEDKDTFGDGRHDAFITTDLINNDNNVSNFDHDTDNDKSTEINPYSRSNSVEQEETDAEKVTQNTTLNINNDTANPHNTKRISNFYSNLSAESDNPLSHKDIESPIKDLTPSLSLADTNASMLSTENQKSIINLSLGSDNLSGRANIRPVKNFTSNSIVINSDTDILHKERPNNKKLNLFSYLLTESDSLTDEGNNENPIDNSTLEDFKLKYSAINVVSEEEPSADNASPNYVSENPIDNSTLESVQLKYSALNVVNEKELSTDNASHNYVSATDVAHKVANKDTLKRKTFNTEKCDETVENEREVSKKIKQMKDKNAKDDETKLNQDQPTQHIPHLSAYTSSSSGNSETQNKTPRQDYSATNLKSDTKINCSRKPTLGIARYRYGSKQHLNVKKIKSRNIVKAITGKDNLAPNKLSIQNTSELIQKDTCEPNDTTTIADIKLIKNKHERSSGNTKQGLKRRKQSQSTVGSTPILRPTTSQSKIVDEKTLTSISEASKLRNLDGDFNSSSSGVKKCCLENASRNLTDYDERSNDKDRTVEKTVTSISDASRKRNLDQSIISSSDKGQSQQYFEEASNETSTHSNIPENPNKSKPKRMKRRSKTSVIQKSNSVINETSSSSKIDETNTQNQSKLKISSPLKLSKKAIKEAFYEQDKQFYASRGSTVDLAKIWERRLKRPTVQQIQRSTCLATIRKTKEGVEVIPEKEKKKRKNFKSKGKILSSTSSSVNMHMFSDKNAKTFDQFIQSDEKDFKSFNFNFGYGEASASRNDGKMFNFQQANAVSIEVVQGRNRSEELTPMSQYSNLPFLTQNADFTLTPEGYYKHNRDDIEQLIRKYN